MNRLLISAANKSSGKTILSMGLCAALRNTGLAVQPFKKGPDYIDPMWLSRAAGRPCYNLDFYTADNDEILEVVRHKSCSAHVSIIEGNKGLHDGLDVLGTNSNAALARLTQTPVVLVLDTRGTIRGVAPLLLGYQAFDPEVRIAGVILNMVAGRRHEGKLRAVIEHYTDIPVLGAVHRDRRLQLTERHLGLIPSNEQGEADGKIADIATSVAAQVDLQAVMSIARSAGPLPGAGSRAIRESAGTGPGVRIGIVRDQAFGFYYPGDLEALERGGAELVAINAIHDPALPRIDGLFIGGGFPETHMDALEANASMRTSIRDAIEGGLPVYAECGGLMYLTRSLRWGGNRREMVGAIRADTLMHSRPQGRGYVRLRETGEGLWPAPGGEEGSVEIPAHEFHYSSLQNLASDTRFAYRMVRGSGIAGKHDGIVYRNTLACYAHLRDTRRHHWTQRFLAFVRGAG